MSTIKLEKELKFSDLSISLLDVYQAMGCNNSFENSMLECEVNGLLQELASFLRPRFSIFSVDGSIVIDKQELSVGLCSFSIGRVITKQLRQSQLFVFFVATAGVEFETWQHSSAIQNDILKSYIADSIGSIIAEKCADVMEEELQACLDSLNWRHTNRYSPGYCGWEVSEQQQLFSLFSDSTPCGVHLNESNLMIPIKSVSGVIGIGEHVRKLDYTCGLCSYENCFRRNRHI